MGTLNSENRLCVEEEYRIDNCLLKQKYGEAARVLVVYPNRLLPEEKLNELGTKNKNLTVVPFTDIGGSVLRKYVSRRHKDRHTALTTTQTGADLLAVVMRAKRSGGIES